MARTGEGAWAKGAAEWARDLPIDPEARRVELARRTEGATVNVRFATRLVQAFEFIVRHKFDEKTVKAGHKTVELLMQLDRISHDEAMKVCGTVLSGKMTRPVLDELIVDVRNKVALQKKLPETIYQVIDECLIHLDSDDRKFDWVEPSTGDYSLIGVDAYYSDIDGDIDDNGKYSITSTPTYAIVISPLLPCSQLNGLAAKHFLRAALAAGSLFPMVSLYCTSEEEEKWLKRMIRRSVRPTQPKTRFFYCSPS